MRCLAFVVINLVCVVNDSDESKGDSEKFCFVVDWYVCVVIVTCWMFFSEVWCLPGKNICAILPAFSPIL